MNSSENLAQNQQKVAQNIINDNSFLSLSQDQLAEIINKTDNFLEALYIAPHLFDSDVFKLMKYRENKLKEWRNNGQIAGGTFFALMYSYARYNRGGFYFKSIIRLCLGTTIFSYLWGRFAEYVGNKMYYQQILTKLAVTYNITDSEIEELHFKLNEAMIKENSEEQNKGSSLDKVKFKF